MSLEMSNSEDPVGADDPAGEDAVDHHDAADLAWRRERFRVFYDKHRTDIWRYSIRRAATVDQAEDIFADTFAAAWKQFEEIPGGHQERLWLFGVARNHFRNSWRKGKRRQALDERILAEGSHRAPDDPADLAPSAAGHVLAALNKLGPKDREVLQLVAWEDLSHAEIGVTLGCSENAVALRLRRARSRLAKELTRTLPERDTARKSRRKS